MFVNKFFNKKTMIDQLYYGDFTLIVLSGEVSCKNNAHMESNYPPGSKSEALQLGVHLILFLYLCFNCFPETYIAILNITLPYQHSLHFRIHISTNKFSLFFEKVYDIEELLKQNF